MIRSARSRKLQMIAAVAVFGMFTAACDITQWAPGGASRPTYCDPTDILPNDGHAGHSHYVDNKGPLSDIDCLVLNVELTVGEAFGAQFPTAAIAEANGYFRLAPFVSGQGTHHMDTNYGIPSQFDPWRPTMMMYDSNAKSGKLTGIVWVVNSGAEPPEGFLGANDHWHNHQTLCFRGGTIIGDGLTDAECAAIGGANLDTSGNWLLHVWLPKYKGWVADDIFNKTHPLVP